MKDMKKRMMSDPEKMAKMSTLEDIKKMMSDSMVGKLHGLKKVSVMSDTPEGLGSGLQTAKELIDSKVSQEQDAEPHENDDEQMSEMVNKDDRGMEEDDADDSDTVSEEDIDNEIAELQAMKDKLKQRKPVNAYNHSEPSKL